MAYSCEWLSRIQARCKCRNCMNCLQRSDLSASVQCLSSASPENRSCIQWEKQGLNLELKKGFEEARILPDLVAVAWAPAKASQCPGILSCFPQGHFPGLCYKGIGPAGFAVVGQEVRSMRKSSHADSMEPGTQRAYPQNFLLFWLHWAELSPMPRSTSSEAWGKQNQQPLGKRIIES